MKPNFADLLLNDATDIMQISENTPDIIMTVMIVESDNPDIVSII